MRISVAAVMIFAFLSLAQDAQQGIAPRAAATDYAANSQWQNISFGASLVPSKQVEHLFAFDISRTYAVFEVACYANSGAALKISLASFVIKNRSSIDPIHQADADTVASVIERQNEPSIPNPHGIGVGGSATVGVAHGTDPYTGRPVTSVYTAGQVTADNNPRDSAPPPSPKPGGTPEDRRLLATQLRARSLPEGPVNHPVAGYLYFRKSDIKSNPDGTYELQYLAEDESAGTTHVVTLFVPVKPR